MNAHYKKGKYLNPGDVKMSMSMDKLKKMTKDYMQKQERIPPFVIPRKTLDIEAFESQDSFVWMGHSTILARIDNITFIVDPMLSLRASPLGFMGPKRFDGSLLHIDELPPIDVILITHNHYDHLDRNSIMQLQDRVKHIFMPLDNAKIIIAWGVDASKIKEFDWYEEHHIGETTFAFTPTQHFSGRNLHDRDKYLWGSWSVKGKQHSIYVSGDSGYNTHFKAIGEKYGPFDVAFLECGAYNESWKEIHMLPEESVLASLDLQAKVMLPMHWAGFNLSTHAWDEPISRALEHAHKLKVLVTTPMIGEVASFDKSVINIKWWLDVSLTDA